MDPLILTVLDTTGIQNYVFGSNSLKHIIGASHLVHVVTHEWTFDALEKCGKVNLVNHKEDWRVIKDLQIEKDSSLDIELLYAGGGNVIFLSRSRDMAKKFSQMITRRILIEAPGLGVAIVHQSFDWEKNQLSEAINALSIALQEKKARFGKPAPNLGLSVTAECQYTGQPAVMIDKQDNDRRVSEEVLKKKEAADKADNRLEKVIGNSKVVFQNNFNEIGDKGTSSYLAVVHIDGNGMGKRIQALDRNLSNRDYIRTLREFSESIEVSATLALKKLVESLEHSIDEDGKISGKVKVKSEKGKYKLPFRPLVYGGDDLTFVCDGRLALTLSANYLKFLLSQKLSDGQSFSTRAGIAVVKSHYPFARAYHLAEDLAESAKEYINYLKEKEHADNPAVMDWHFASSGPVLEIPDIRKREYTVPDGTLAMRPVQVGNTHTWRTFENFSNVVTEFQSEKWAERKNKLMELREVLRDGRIAVENFLKLFNLGDLPKISGTDGSEKSGWFGNNCTCFDAIEALDFFVPLKGDLNND